MNFNKIFMKFGSLFKKLFISIGEPAVQKKKTEDRTVYFLMLD